MASSASTSSASIEPAVHTNSTGRSNAKSSAAASRALTNPTVKTMKMSNGVVQATYDGYGFIRVTYGCRVATWRCDLLECGATLKTYCINGQHRLTDAEPHDEDVHMRGFRRPPGGDAQTPSTPREGGKRKAASCADKPPDTANGDAEVPAKKSSGGVFKNALQDTPQGKAEDAAGDNNTIESAKGSGVGNLVDSRAAAHRRGSVHFQHPRGSNAPGTSAWPSGDQGAQESEILPPPTPPPRADHADTVQNDADDGDDNDFILIDDPIDGDANADASLVRIYQGQELLHEEVGGLRQELDGKVYPELKLLREEVGGLRQEIDGLKEVHAAPSASSLPPPVLPKLPMETDEDFAALKTFLADKSNFKYMVSYLKSFDGSTLEEKADGMMTGLFSLELAATYNYKKRSTGKLVFEGTVTEKAVRRAAMESFRGLASKEYTFHLGKRFRYAYARLKREDDARILKILRACRRAGPEVVQYQQ